jgi:glycolate oxidase FAD binding subunit
LGIISQLTFRTYPLPEASATVVVTGDGGAIARLAQTILLSSLTPTALELLAPVTTQALDLGQNFGLLVRFQSISASVEQQSQTLQQQAASAGLAATTRQADAEASLWKQLREKWDHPLHGGAITCKMGVRPTSAVEVLTQMGAMELGAVELGAIDNSLTLATVHAGSGIGTLHLPAETSAAALQQLRELCQAHSGYLTVQRAPTAVKQSFDLWGIRPDTLPLMQGLKQRFDPQNLLSRDRLLPA